MFVCIGCETSRVDSNSMTLSEREAREGTLSTEVTFSRPEECWEYLLAAKASGDRFAMIQCVATKDRFAHLGSLAYEIERLIMFNTPMKQSAIGLLSDHGLSGVDIIGALQVADSPGGKGAGNIFPDVGRMITEPTIFAKKATDLLASVPMPPNESVAPIPATNIVSMEIQGDKATAEITIEGIGQSQTVQFMREDGSWRITSDGH